MISVDEGLFSPGLKRRTLVFGGAAAVVANSVRIGEAEINDSLKARAARKGLTFGSEVTVRALRESTLLSNVIIADCAMIVPGVEMKWGVTEKNRGKSDYQNGEILADFAKANGMSLRGHTALWHRNTPSWTNGLLNTMGGKDVLLKRVADVVSHFRGRVIEWDVVNEALEPSDNLPGEMRNWPPFAKGDPGYVAEAFHAAAEADPGALLFYNDYGFEYYSDGQERKRAGALRLIEELRKRNTPLHGFGVQSHLKVGNNFKANVFRKFLADIAAYDLKISLTELDINDDRLPYDIAERDKGVADHAQAFLEAAFDEPAVTRLLVWGMSDANTWLNSDRPRQDGFKHRALPLDENYKRKPLWHAIAKAFDNASPR